MAQSPSAKPMALGGQTKICKSVLAYNTVDLTGRSVWALTGVQALFAGHPVVASERAYEVIARHFEAGQRIPPDQAATHQELLKTHSTIMTYIATEDSGAAAAYWPVAPDLISSFLDTDKGVAIMGEGDGQVRLLLVAEDEDALLALASLAMTGRL